MGRIYRRDILLRATHAGHEHRCQLVHTSTVRECIFNDLTNGTTYSFDVRATRSGVDGAYSSQETGTPVEPIVALTDWGGSISTGESNDFSVRINGLSPSRHYEVILGRENAGGALGFVEECSTNHESQIVPSGSSATSRGYTLYGCSPRPSLTSTRTPTTR